MKLKHTLMLLGCLLAAGSLRRVRAQESAWAHPVREIQGQIDAALAREKRRPVPLQGWEFLSLKKIIIEHGEMGLTVGGGFLWSVSRGMPQVEPNHALSVSMELRGRDMVPPGNDQFSPGFFSYSYGRLIATSRDVFNQGKSGSRRIVTWQFTISENGILVYARQKIEDEASRGSQTTDMNHPQGWQDFSPAGEVASAQWRILSAQLLKLGSIEI